MIFFVWSLVVDAVNFSRRSRLNSVVSEFLERRSNRDGMLLKRLARTASTLTRIASAPVVCSDSAFLYKTETFQITSMPKRCLQFRGWSIVPSDAYSGRTHTGSPIFFVAALYPAQSLPENFAKSAKQVEGSCPSVAWRTEDELEIVFACPNKETFLEIAQEWAENSLLYKEQFQIDSIEVVDLDPQFHILLAKNCKTKPTCVSVLERVFMDEISAARDLSDSLKAADLDILSGATSVASSGFTSPILEERTFNPPISSANATRGSSSVRSTPCASSSSGFTSPLMEEQEDRIFSIPYHGSTPSVKSPSAKSTPSHHTLDTSPGPRAPLADFDSFKVSESFDSMKSVEIKIQDCDVTPRPDDLETPRAENLENVGSCITPVKRKFEDPKTASPKDRFSSATTSPQSISSINEEIMQRRTESPLLLIQEESNGNHNGSGSSGSRGIDLSTSLPQSSLRALPPRPANQRRRLSLYPTPAAANDLSDTDQLDYPPSRIRRRSLSPLMANAGDAKGPNAADGVTGWRRANSFRSLERRRYSSFGGVKTRVETLRNANTAPPNVLIYIGDDCPNEQTFRLKKAVQSCLDPSSYAVYLMNLNKLLISPWQENTTCLLITDTDGLGKEGWDRVEEYFRKGGKLLFICQNRLLASLTDCKNTRKRVGVVKLAFSSRDKSTGGSSSALGKDFESFMKRVGKALKKPHVMEHFQAKDLVGGLRYSITVMREEGTPLVLYMQNGKDAAGALFTDATLEAFLFEESNLVREAMERLEMDLDTGSEDSSLTNGTILTSPPQYPVLATGLPSLKKIQGDPSILFSAYATGSVASETELPVVADGTNTHPEFDARQYFRHNRALYAGRCVLFSPIVTSTMDIMQTLLNQRTRKAESFVVIAKRQTKGKGRGGNQWLSPEGCAMFSFPLQISLKSKLGKASGFIQHLLALATVDAIQKMVKIDDFPLKIKWPNDIYFHRSHKMGGVLVNCTVSKEELLCVLGCGLNVSNDKPTLCLNDILPPDRGGLTIEAVIGEIMTRMEELVADFQDTGPSSVLPLYYRYWLHSREDVSIKTEDMEEKAIIRGLDYQGFLEVRSKQTGKLFSVQPDGNSFDMMKNLIKMKS